MDRKAIEAFEKAHHYILPESYINFLLICDNHPEKYCKGYRDIILYSLEELPEERKLYEMDEFCPEYYMHHPCFIGTVIRSHRLAV